MLPLPPPSSSSSSSSSMALRDTVFGGPLVWAHVEGPERSDAATSSLSNAREAGVVIDVVRWLVDFRRVLAPADVVVIAMCVATPSRSLPFV
jgi:hypothetical protein